MSGRLAALAASFGDRTALCDLGHELTFAELVARTEAIAGAVQAAPPRGDGPIAVLAPLDHRFFLAFLGVLRAGAIALVLDPDHPRGRLRLIAAGAGVEAVLTTQALAGEAAALVTSGTPVLTVESALAAGRRPTGDPRPEGAAYILYTSGSTGAPKGVVHSHANALNDAAINGISPGFTPDDVSAVYYAGTMGTVRNGLGILLAGGQLHVLPARRLGAEPLVDEIRRRRLTVLQGVPTLFRRIADTVCGGSPLESVRLVRLVGDRSQWSDLDLARRTCGPEVQMQVAIGSTECSSTFASWTVDEALRTPGRLPVGRPPPGVSVTLVDEQGAPVGGGEPGEAIVSSRRLALGYWREPALTAAAFGVSPQDEAMRTFATGDVCVRRPDGLLEFAGRKDRMVKIRGHRLEPGEVEAALQEIEGVADAGVVVRRRADGLPTTLVGYVELGPEGWGLLPRHVLALLSQRLPAHMLPSAIHFGRLPRLPNLKLDRLALERTDSDRTSELRRRAADPILDATARVFESVVGCEGATGEDDLLSLGGDSLQAVELILELERRLAVAVSLEVFSHSRTIAELAAWIRAQQVTPAICEPRAGLARGLGRKRPHGGKPRDLALG